jgi:hypothetical protein
MCGIVSKQATARSYTGCDEIARLALPDLIQAPKVTMFGHKAREPGSATPATPGNCYFPVIDPSFAL